MASIILHSFSQAEIDASEGNFVDASFTASGPLRHQSQLRREDYLARACTGGYPEALTRVERRRDDWYRAYLTQIVNRDAVDISGLQRLSDLPRLLRLIAGRAGSTMVWTGLANDAAMPRRTLDPYVRLLETLYLIHVLPAWSANVTKRETKQPKVFPLDSGLGASLFGLTPKKLGHGSPAAGGLLESFVVGEVRRQLGWSTVPAEMFHYRDSRGMEVDIVLEAADGRVVGIEIKAAHTVQAKDIRGLTALREGLGDRFVAGYVLHTGTDTQAVGRRITAVPVGALWER